MVPSLVSDFVFNRGNRLQIPSDGEAVFLGQILVSSRRALDHLAHQARSHVTIGLIPGREKVSDLPFGPLTNQSII